MDNFSKVCVVCIFVLSLIALIFSVKVERITSVPNKPSSRLSSESEDFKETHNYNKTLCFQDSGIYLRRSSKFENFGPGGWIRSLIDTIATETNQRIYYSEKDLEPLNENLINQFLTQKCPFKGIIYQMPTEYLLDYSHTNGKLSLLQSKIYFGPFGVESIEKDPEKFNHSHFLVDNVGVYNHCTKFSNVVNCYLQPQCASVSVINHALTIPSANKTIPILYLKSRNELTWNDTIIDAIKESNHKYGFPDFKVFIYGFYDNKLFAESLLTAPFAVVFSPWETMGLYHIEIRQNKVPVFSLSSRGVTAFTPGLSGEIAEAGSLVGYPKEWHVPFNSSQFPSVKPILGVPLPDIIDKFGQFLKKLDTYDPIKDLRDCKLVPPQCTQLIRNVFGR